MVLNPSDLLLSRIIRQSCCAIPCCPVGCMLALPMAREAGMPNAASAAGEDLGGGDPPARLGGFQPGRQRFGLTLARQQREAACARA